MPLTKIQSLGITDGTIVNADINASAAIAGTKISGSFGKVLQVVQTVKSDTASSTSATFTDISGMSASITPTSASNKILVFFDIGISAAGGSSGCPGMIKLLRGSTSIYVGDAAGSRETGYGSIYTDPTYYGDAYAVAKMTGVYLDSPSTTSSTTYKVQFRANSAGTTTVYLNSTGDTSNNANLIRTASSVTLMEIAA
jgi:hypothetical protein